jgi:hypothetical protein
VCDKDSQTFVLKDNPEIMPIRRIPLERHPFPKEFYGSDRDNQKTAGLIVIRDCDWGLSRRDAFGMIEQTRQIPAIPNHNHNHNHNQFPTNIPIVHFQPAP